MVNQSVEAAKAARTQAFNFRMGSSGRGNSTAGAQERGPQPSQSNTLPPPPTTPTVPLNTETLNALRSTSSGRHTSDDGRRLCVGIQFRHNGKIDSAMGNFFLPYPESIMVEGSDSLFHTLLCPNRTPSDVINQNMDK